MTTGGCSVPTGFTGDDTDCNDLEVAINPGASEICDLRDNDCDGSVDEGVGSTFYADADGDSFGNSGSTIVSCSAPDGFTGNTTDCNDTNRYEQPGQTWYVDADVDLWSNGTTQVSCARP